MAPVDGRLQREGSGSAWALGREAFCDLERWLASETALQLALRAVECETERRGREVLRRQVQAHVDARGTGDRGCAVRVRKLGEPSALYLRKRLHPRSLVTVFGTIVIARTAYCKAGRAAIHPLDAALQLPARKYSYEVQRRLVKAAVQGPFDAALEALADHGIHLAKRTAEQIVLEAGVDFEAFYNERTRSFYEPQALILVAAIDSKGIPMVKPERARRSSRQGKGEKRQKKRMSTIAAVFTQGAEKRTAKQIIQRLFSSAELVSEREPRRRPEHKRVWASLITNKDLFIPDVRQEMLRRDPDRQKQWVIVTDGERGLQRRVSEHFRDITLILDFLHVLEKLWRAAYAIHPEGSLEAESFVRLRAERILDGHVSQVVKGLRQIVTKRKLLGIKRKAMLDAAGYFYRNRARMGYDDYLEKGWPIASGSVEGACKNLIKDRMERSGMRWTPPGAEAMLRLRALYLSGDFEDYWDYHVRQDQQRLYPYHLRPVS